MPACARHRGHRRSERRRSASARGKGPVDRLAFDVLHHQVVRADVVELADVGMIQGGDGAGFALEAFAELALARP